MTLSDAWTRLELAAPDERSGRMVQRVHPESAIDLYATLETGPGSRRRAVELEVDGNLVAGIDPPEGTGGVECRIDARPPARAAVILSLTDPGATDLFAALCEDVVAATAACRVPDQAVGVWLGRFAKWRRMLRGGRQGLSPERQRGLYGELLTIRDHLIPALGFDEAIRAWLGPDGAPHDFETGGCGVEVKTSAANEPQVVSINGERQLDDTGLDPLMLVHHSLEVLRDAGDTLPGLVAELRGSGTGHPEAGTLEDRLLQTGYADVHEPRYSRTGYEQRRLSVFRVRDGFPRITEATLVDGVGDVHYRLAIDACREHEVESSTLGDVLTATAGPDDR
jgi:hypothetical protein